MDRRVDRLEDQVTQLDPLLPSERKQGPLLEKCHDLIRACERLAGFAAEHGRHAGTRAAAKGHELVPFQPDRG